ncbi:hypothetical protein ETAA8_57480 [Anatilimnocola aggregata]|uniref:Uncharacterized protein n=1 Tax=Anatilimnocola aggregata TaxID=2528021 RepID=A0A517YK58_9BACT|nr:hypothetical protein [Anatilimnocola aggregata]QDU30602.1 hypothetical protein ETAA8_57480 [Anatilimnocola aggregata]
MPGPKGNRNRTTHGTYGFLAIGSLPKGASYIRRQLGVFEKFVANAVKDKHGAITLYRAALIQSAVRHEGRAQLLTRWLRDGEAGLKLLERMAVLREIGAASDQRDRVLKLLDLEIEDAGFASLYTSPATLAQQDTISDAPAISSPGSN